MNLNDYINTINQRSIQGYAREHTLWRVCNLENFLQKQG
jgi:hypothetical protein